jgi:hypothetical protein
MSRSKTNRHSRSNARRPKLETLEPRLALNGTWTPVTNLPPTDTIGQMVLLSDGSVLVSKAPKNGNGITSQKLTPDANGSYVNGTWSPLAPMNLPHAYGSRALLPDGRLYVLGATNGTSTNSAEIYNPLTNVWTIVAPFPETTFSDGPAILLTNGLILAGSINDPNTYLYNPATNSWSSGPTKLYGDSSLNETWTLLPDGSVMSYDVNGNPGEAQRLDPTTMTWIDSGSPPVPLEAGISAFPTMGPGMLLPDGRLLQLGRSSNTAIYTLPVTPGGTGTWTAGPVIPGGLEAGGEGPQGNVGSAAAMLPNGHVLFDADMPDSGGPTKFFEFDPTANTVTDVTPSIVTQFQTLSESSATSLLTLPTGQVMLGINNGAAGAMGNQAYIYTPDGAPQVAWKPTISSIVANGDHYTLTGTQLNGLSAGSSHGGNTSAGTNYPIVQLTDGAGHAYYARTSNWSSTGVATGNTPVTTNFSIPSNVPYRSYSLSVIANGIASNPVTFIGGTPSANDMYAWDITAATTTKGHNTTTSVSVVVHRDSNVSGLGDSSDALVSNATVTVELRNSSGTLVGTSTGTTSKQGVFTSSSFSNLPSGTYVAEVTALTSSTYTWNKVLDPTPNDTDLDGDNLPDQQFTIGTAGAASPLTTATESHGRRSIAARGHRRQPPPCPPCHVRSRG